MGTHPKQFASPNVALGLWNLPPLCYTTETSNEIEHMQNILLYVNTVSRY